MTLFVVSVAQRGEETFQRMKEAQVMQKVTRRSSDAGPMDDRLPCKGKVAISGKLLGQYGFLKRRPREEGLGEKNGN